MCEQCLEKGQQRDENRKTMLSQVRGQAQLEHNGLGTRYRAREPGVLSLRSDIYELWEDHGAESTLPFSSAKDGQ